MDCLEMLFGIFCIVVGLALGVGAAAPLVVLQAVVGQPCNIRLDMPQAGAPLGATIDFGDGGSRSHYGDLASLATLSAVFVQHVYQRTGSFTVWANVSGGASWKTSAIDVVVVAPSSALQLRLLDTDVVVPVLHEVMVLASVGADIQPVTFDWDFGDATGDLWTTVLSSNSTSSLASHKYGVAGSYPVRVVASGQAITTPIAVELPALLEVVEPVGDVHLIPLLGRYAAPLKLCGKGDYCTDEVAFEARTDQGSHVDFEFDFGDGTQTNVVAKLDLIRNVPSGQATHAYRQEGAYGVCVTANNPLGSSRKCLKQPFAVQTPPEGLRLSEVHYVALVGKVVRFKALLTAGTNVSFDWQIAGQRMVDAGSELTHVFTTTGSSNILATAYNKVTDLAYGKPARPSVAADLSVRNALQGVQLEIVSNASTYTQDQAFSTKQSIEFVAHLQPPPGGGEVYLWTWGDQRERKRRTLTNRMMQAFHEYGRYRLLVTVDNAVSSVQSSPVDFCVVQEVEGLRRVLHPASILRARNVPFEALFSHGSDLTFEWDFGDGTPTQSTSEKTTYHTFQSLGEYHVTVKLRNPLGGGQLNTTVFVLDVQCHPPLVALLGIKNDFTAYRGEDVLAEADAEVECEASTRLSYLWSVVGPSATYRGQRRLLRMPTKGMAAGSYAVHLRVQLNGTIVYTDIMTSFLLVEPPLKAQIEGSSIRTASRHDDVTIIGSTNKNGGPSDSGVVTSFEWKCVSPTNPKSDCFTNQGLIWNKTHIRFAASLLDPELDQFLFTLLVRHGPESAMASQVLQLTTAPEVLHVALLCTSCQDRIFVAKPDRVAISARCAVCPSTARFEWQLWLVLDGNQNLPISQSDCVQPDGSTFYLVTNSSDAEWNATLDDDDNSTMPGPLMPKNRKRQRIPTIKLSTEKPSRTTVVPPESSDARDDSAQDRSDRRWTQALLGGVHSDTNITEGFAGEAGSAAARDLATALAMITRNVKDQPGPTGRPAHRRVDLSRASKRRRVKVDSFATKQWVSMHLLEEDTVTGLNTNKLVIKSGVLKPGRTYVAILDVQDSDHVNLRGRTMQEIRMHAGPSNGRCLVHPIAGYEYLTVFKLNCLEWSGMDPNRPLFYELSYKLRDSGAAGTLIRFGLDSSFKFVLPAGIRENDHNVYLNVAIHQVFGGQTDVCALSVKIRPLSHHPNTSAEELIDEELNKPRSGLRLALDKDDIPQVFNRIQVAAGVLNSRSDTANGNFSAERNGKVFNPHKVRQVLLSWICSVNISTKEEALQMLAAVNSLLETAEQVKFSFLETASKIVHFASTFFTLRKHRFEFASMYYRSSMQILDSLFRNLASISSSNFIYTKDLVSLFESCEIALQRSLAHRLGYTAAWELPLEFKSDYLSLEATCLAPSSTECTYSSDVINFRFRQSKNVLLECICVERITFHHYLASGLENATKSTLPVVSTSFIHCNGSPFNPGELQPVSPVTVNIPATSRFTKNAAIFGTLYQQSMEVYSFVVSGNTTNQHLVIHVQFEEDFQNRKTKYAFRCCRRECSTNGPINPINRPESLSQPSVMKGGSTYHIGLVCADFATRDFKQSEKRPKLSANYTLDMNFIECVQWDSNETAWSSNGCSVLYSETSAKRDSISCRCDMLTDYSALVHNLSYSHSRIDTTKLLRKPLNPVVPAMMVFVVIMFVVLIIGSMRISLGRVHVCDRIWLKDNSRSDRYAYLLTVQTGYRPQSGTSSAVYIVLHGENGASEPRELYEEARHVIFNRGSRNSFFVTTSSNLGSIWKVQLWHNCSGLNPSWFLDHVIVQDLSTGSHYYFQCGDWLTVEDGRVEKEILVSDNHINFFQLYRSKFWQFYNKLNIWDSLYQRPPCDHVVHFERIVLCLTSWTVTFTLSALSCHSLDFTLNSLPSMEFLQAGACISIIGLVLQIIPTLVLHRSKLPSCKKKMCVTSKTCRNSDDHLCQNVHDGPFVFWKPVQDWVQKQWHDNVPDVGILLTNLEKEVLPPRCSSSSDLSAGTSCGNGDYACSSNDECHWNKRLDSASPNFLQQSRCPYIKLGLPVQFRYTCWIFCCAVTFGCVVATCWIAARFSMSECLIWLLLTVTSVSMASCIFLPLLVAACTAPLALHPTVLQDGCVCQFKCHDAFNDESSKASCKENKNCHATDMEAKQRLRYLRYARPPEEWELKDVEKQTALKKTVFSFVRNTLAAVIIFAILLVAAFGSADSSTHLMNRTLLKQFRLHGYGLRQFNNFNNATQWLGYVTTSLIPSLYGSLGRQVVPDVQKEFWYVGQTGSILVGKPHLHVSRLVDQLVKADVAKNVSTMSSLQNAWSLYLPRFRNEVNKLMDDLKKSPVSHVNCSSAGVKFWLYNLPTAYLSEIRFTVSFPPVRNRLPSIEINTVRLKKPVGIGSAMLAVSKVMLFLLLIWNVKYFLEYRFLQRHSFFSMAVFLKILFTAVLFVYMACIVHLVVVTSALANSLEDSRYSENADISTVTMLNKICNGALGLLLIFHTARCLLLISHSAAMLKIERFASSGPKTSLVLFCAIFVLFVSYTYLGMLWQLPEKGFGSLNVTGSYLILLVTRNVKIGHTFQRERIFTFIFVASLLGLIACTISCGVMHTLNSWKSQLNPSFTFGINDIFLVMKTTFITCLSSDPASQQSGLPETIPIEILYNELESQVDELLFRVDQLCQYEGLRFADDFGCPQMTSQNLNMSSEQEDDVLHFAVCDGQDCYDSLSLSTEKLAWPDSILAKDGDSDNHSSSSLNDDRDERKLCRVPAWPFGAAMSTSSGSEQDMDTRLWQLFPKRRISEQRASSTESLSSANRPPSNNRKKGSRNRRIGNDRRNGPDRNGWSCHIKNVARRSGETAGGRQVHPKKGRIHRTKTRGKELLRKKIEFCSRADCFEMCNTTPLDVQFGNMPAGSRTLAEIVLEPIPIQHLQNSDTEESQN